MKTQLLATIATLGLAASCVTDAPPFATAPPLAPAAADDGGEGRLEPADAQATHRAPRPTCEARIAALELPEPSERHEAYVDGLPYIVVGARIVPALYLEWPRATEDEGAAQIRERLAASRRARRAVRDVLRRHRGDRALLRQVFLSEGYLFSERPELARALVRELSLSHLFDDPEIFRYRSGRAERLRRDGEGYVDAEGRPARLLLNDRVARTAEELARPLHLDLSQLRAESGALRTLPRGLADGTASFELIYPDGSHRAALVDLGATGVRVLCVGGDLATLEGTLADAERFWQRQRAIQQAARRITDERLRFDEPIGEPEGVQEDGQLRLAWRQAYRSGRRTFTFREVEYPVFDHRGNPVPPQVCVDFIFDTWERAGGTWYRSRGSEPGRTSGEVDFSGLEGLHRRSISAVLAYAAEDPSSPIERYDVPRSSRVPLRRQERFARALSEQADEIREGDALIIHGLREQDMRAHFHSVVVLSTDPLTGVPMEVGDNQGRPRIGTLELAMRAAPLRSIKHRLRVDYGALSGSDA